MQSAKSKEARPSKGTTTMQPAKLMTEDLLLDPLGKTRLGRVMKPRFARLLTLDYQGWTTQFEVDGFTDTDVETLEEFLQDSFNEAELAESLAYLLKGINEQAGESEINEALMRWAMNSGWNNIWDAVCTQKFPDPIDAAAYVGRHLLDVASSTLAFELARGKSLQSTDCDWNISEAEVNEGIELAEEGLSEDTAEWPPY
jgi:hypothetical protein